RRLGPVERAARLSQGRRVETARGRARAGGPGGVFGRPCRGVGVHRAARGRPRVGSGGTQRGRGAHLQPRSGEAHGDGGRRGAGGERAAHRELRGVPPPVAAKQQKRYAEAVRSKKLERKMQAAKSLVGLWLAAFALSAFAQARELPDFTT